MKEIPTRASTVSPPRGPKSTTAPVPEPLACGADELPTPRVNVTQERKGLLNRTAKYVCTSPVVPGSEPAAASATSGSTSYEPQPTTVSVPPSSTWPSSDR